MLYSEKSHIEFVPRCKSIIYFEVCISHPYLIPCLVAGGMLQFFFFETGNQALNFVIVTSFLYWKTAAKNDEI